jgi:HAMP domain-containing protein
MTSVRSSLLAIEVGRGMLEGMDAPPGPTAPDERGRARATGDVRMHVRRSPKYGVFMALGALIGAVLAWWLSVTVPPALDPAGEAVDTTPVIGLMLVVGFFIGGAIGALIAVMIDRAMSKRLTPVVAERTEVHEADAPGDVDDDAPARADRRDDDAPARADGPEDDGTSGDDRSREA